MRQGQGNFYNGAAVIASGESDILDFGQKYGYCFHFKWTKNSGTVAGSFKIQGSNDNVNFIDITSESVALTDANGEGYLMKDAVYFQHIKIVLTVTGGNFDFDCYLGTKG